MERGVRGPLEEQTCPTPSQLIRAASEESVRCNGRQRTHGSKRLGPRVTPWVLLGTLLRLVAIQPWKYEWHAVRDKSAKNIFLGLSEIASVKHLTKIRAFVRAQHNASFVISN